MLKKQLINDDSVPQLANMEANVRQKLQPVRGTTFEQTKTDTISDTPVSTKCSFQINNFDKRVNQVNCCLSAINHLFE